MIFIIPSYEWQLNRVRQPLVVGGDEQGIERSRWQGVPGRFMRNRIRKDDWVCIVCAKDLAESKALEWYNTELARDPPPPTSLLFAKPRQTISTQGNGQGHSQAQPVVQASPQAPQVPSTQAAVTGGGFFSSIKKGFNDLGDKFNDLTNDTPIVSPPPPRTLLPPPSASNFTDRQVLHGNQLPKYPSSLATSRDTDGHPVFLAIFHHSSGAMLPAKICPNLRNPIRVAWEASEYSLTKDDKYETFLENPEIHKWIRCSNSIIPTNESESKSTSLQKVIA